MNNFCSTLYQYKMGNTINQVFEKQSFVLVAARFLERISFYGIHALLFSYLRGETMNLPPTANVGIIFIRFMAYALIAQLLGAYIGDVFAGNRRAMIFGGFVQAAGCFCLCIPGLTGFYTGLGMIVLGSGLFTSNIVSEFGKLFISKPKLMDTGFTVLYLVVSMGAFLAPLFAGHIGWNASFITCGVLMLAASGLVIAAGASPDISLLPTKKPDNQRFVKILGAFFLLCLFWTLYDICGSSVYRLTSSVTGIRTPLNPFRTDLLSTAAAGAAFAFFWYRFHFRSGIKLTIGFLLAAISSGLFLLIPDVDGRSWYPVYVFAVLLSVTAEIHIVPVTHSVIAQNASPKYFAIWMSISIIPMRIMGYYTGFFSSDFLMNPQKPFIITFVLMTTTGLLLLVYSVLRRDKTGN